MSTTHPSFYLFFLIFFTITNISSSSSVFPPVLFPSDWFQPAAPSTQIRNACNAATRCPSVCESALTNSPNLRPDPTVYDLIQSLISTSYSNSHVAKSKAKVILASAVASFDVNLTVAAKNCIEGLTYSRRRLAAASIALKDLASAAAGGGSGGGDQESIADARAWASAALLYHSGCLSGLSKVNGTEQVDNAMALVSHLTNVTSSALSMVFALQRYGNDISKWGPPQTERDGYWGDDVGAPMDEKALEIGSSAGVPSGLVPNITVCRDGCRYQMIQDAVDAAPDYGSSPFVIYVKEGVYNETVRVRFRKTNVVLVGDGMGKTVITGNLNVGMLGMTTYNSATVGVLGDGFMASNLTISNTAGPDAHQAVAFRSDSDKSIIENVEFIGHQDTLYPHSLRQLYKSCTIAGTVDFIFGDAAAVFQDCRLLIVPRQLSPEQGGVSVVTAQGRIDPAESTGFVFYNCVVNGSVEYWKYYSLSPTLHVSYLGRPWKTYSRSVFINCYLEKIITDEGWSPWIGDFALDTLFFGEFNSTGPGAKAIGRVAWSNQIEVDHLSAYSVRNFIQIY